MVLMSHRSRWTAVHLVAVAVTCTGLATSASAAFIRGDANGDGILDISDPRATLDYLFVTAREVECLAALDTNDDEVVDISDAIASLAYLFLGGVPPRAPFPAAGLDPTPGLACGAAGPADLSCRADGPAVLLSWNLSEPYDAIEVRRDGDEAATLPGTATSYRDTPPAGGDHRYEVLGRSGRDESPGATCTVRDLPDNRAPSLVLLSPAQGTVVEGASFLLRGRVTDESGIARIAVDGRDLALPAPVPLTFTFSADVPRPGGASGPRLIRIEAVDDFGRTAFAELAVGFAPVLREEDEGTAVLIDISSASGYDEIERVVAPFLSGLPALLDQAVRGTRLYETTIAGVDITVDGDRAEVVGPIALELLPSAAGGGRVVLEARIQTVRLFARGRSDFGFLGTDSWDAVWTGNNITISGPLAFSPTPDRLGLDVASEGFTANVGSSSTTVSGFLDPFGIFDALVNSLTGAFRDDIETAVENAVASEANENILPALAGAFSDLGLDFELGLVALATRFHDAVESTRGLTLELDGRWTRLAPLDASWPHYPGSAASFAPFPVLPLPVPADHPIDATISLSRDTLHQALAGIASTGLLSADFSLGGLDSPLPLNVATLARLLDARLLALPEVDPSDGLALQARLRDPPEIVIGEGASGTPLVGAGAEWRWAPGTSEPPPNWRSISFLDSGWNLGASGFGYSSNPDELAGVLTELEEMASGAYTSLYLRASFDIDDPAVARRLLLRVLYDDAFVAYLNGTEVGRRNIGTSGTPPAHDELAAGATEPSVAVIDLLAFRSALRAGRNVIAIQGHNAGVTSSDFILLPELLEGPPAPEGTIAALPARIRLDGLTVTFYADAAGDGTGEEDADGRADEIELFSYSLGFWLETELFLIAGDGTPSLVFSIATGDGPDPDSLPDAIAGGSAGIEIEVASEAFDTDDELLVEFARFILAFAGPSLADALAALELPPLPLPELVFDLDQDGAPDVRLEIIRGTFAPADTDGDSAADWLCILADLRAGAP